MPVVINEFEVVPQAQRTAQEAEPNPARSGMHAPQPDRHELERLEEQLKERSLRVWAH